MSRRTAMAPVIRRTMPRRQGLWRLVLLIIIIAIVTGYYSPAKDYYNRSRQISQERGTTEELRRQHEALLKEKELLATTPYVEQVARRDLGMVKPGEQPYVVRDLNQGEEPPPPVLTPEEDSYYERVTGFIGSLMP